MEVCLGMCLVMCLESASCLFAHYCVCIILKHDIGLQATQAKMISQVLTGGPVHTSELMSQEN